MMNKRIKIDMPLWGWTVSIFLAGMISGAASRAGELTYKWLF